jgi:hypothetical protein
MNAILWNAVITIAILAIIFLVAWRQARQAARHERYRRHEALIVDELDLIEDEGLVDRLVDRATSAAAYDEAIRRVGERSELLTMTYIKVLKEWGY